jgi:hypothetical protein
MPVSVVAISIPFGDAGHMPTQRRNAKRFTGKKSTNVAGAEPTDQKKPAEKRS